MTIFDSLRYPVSNHPTAEQLDAIPIDIFNHWLLHCVKGGERFAGYSSEDLERFYRNRQWADDSIPLLRKAILEWNEPI